MTKVFYTFAILGCLALQQNNAQAQAFQKGNKLVNAGLGLGAYNINILASFIAEKASASHSAIGLGASFEVGITDQISVGGLVGYSRNSSLQTNFIHIGARGSYHLSDVIKLQSEKIDVYAGAGIGFRIMSSNLLKGSDFDGLSKVFIPIHVGGRYYFTDNIAAFSELGTGFSIFQGGITYKF